MKSSFIHIGGFLGATAFGFLPAVALAYTITNTSAPIRGDFVLEPAKIEIVADPGHQSVTEMRVTNRTNEALTYYVSIEDTKGSDNPQSPIMLMGSEEGPYSLRDYIKPEIDTFTLRPGEQIALPVTVTIPGDAEPGGLYGSVLFESRSEGDIKASGSHTISRLGALLFVRVSGEVKEEGALEDFRIAGGSSVFFKQQPMDFELLYRNSGDVHLNPYGMITVRNVFNMPVAEVEVQPYFAMPQSLRYRKVTWEHGPLFGVYRATAEINRGYGDIIENRSVMFTVLPWKEMLIALGLIIILVFVGKWFFTTFEFTRKK
ncbi:MAG: DUF916 domain-containing protein [Candidatus Yonathbacteria bacterium]|nr:DUF916 domain-containing protein [Candidatus Yonathbacteria bacterium]